MMDIRTVFHSAGVFGWRVTPPGLAADDGLETAVIISLFTDRRAEADDALPDGGDDRRGWWGDAYAEAPGDLIGSRLWLLSREKLLPEALRKAKEYAEEALAWMVADGVAERVVVAAEAAERKMIGLAVEIHRPRQEPARFRFPVYWQGGN